MITCDICNKENAAVYYIHASPINGYQGKSVTTNVDLCKDCSNKLDAKMFLSYIPSYVPKPYGKM